MVLPTPECGGVSPLTLVDTRLTSLAGHHATYAHSVGEGSALLGCKYQIVGPTDCDKDVCKQLPLSLLFAPMKTTGPRPMLVVHNAITTLINLKKLMKWLGYTPSLIIVDNLDHHDLLRWAFFFNLLSTQPPHTWIFMLRRLCYQVEKQTWLDGKTHYKLALKLLSLRKHRHVHFVTDSARLQTHYQNLTSQPVHVVPIPHTQLSPPGDNGEQNQPMQFVFLGDAREEKGLLPLIEAIQMVHAEEAGKDIHFTLQTHQASDVRADVAAALNRLQQANDPRINLLDKPLSFPEYQQVLNKAHAVLCPYSKVRYQTTSGPFTEALAAGKPVLTICDTWMSDQLTHFGAGIICRDQKPHTIMQAILQLKNEYAALSQKAAEHRPAWLAVHNPENFVRELIHIAGGAC